MSEERSFCECKVKSVDRASMCETCGKPVPVAPAPGLPPPLKSDEKLTKGW